MGRDRAPRLGADVAESLLRGDLDHAGAPDVLVHLLTAATAPARPYELVREEAAVAALRAPGLAPVDPPRGRALVTRLLTVKVTAAFALTAAGGVALAAVDALPRVSGTSRLDARPTVGSGLGPGTITPDGGPQAASPRTTSTAMPSAHPSSESLCRRLLADQRTGPTGDGTGPAGGRSQSLDPQALATLIALAGGKPAGVWPYCSRLLGVAIHPPSQLPTVAGSATRPSPQYRSADPTSPASPSAGGSYPPQPSPGPGSSQPDSNTADRSPTPTPDSRSATVSPAPGGHR